MNENLDKDGVEYDQRDYERKAFGKGYKNLKQFESKMYADYKQEYFIGFLSQLRALINMILKYTKNEELRENGLNLRQPINREMSNMRKVDNYRPDPETLDIMLDVFEDMRHDANFKIPEKTSHDPETVGIDQL